MDSFLGNNYLIITDLDATLLEHDYSYKNALPALQFLQRHNIPLVLNSSKTVAELMNLAKELKLSAPIIAENGGAIGIPTDGDLDFNKVQDPASEFLNHTIANNYQLLATGLHRDSILKYTHALRAEHSYRFEGFADWTAKQLSAITKLSPEAAKRAKNRQATEPILWHDSEEKLQTFTKKLSQDGIKIVRGGKFLHLMGDKDKSDGAEWVKAAYRKQFPTKHWISLALGDSENDLKMLEQADVAFVIPHDGEIRIRPKNKQTYYAEQEASTGWNTVITTFFNNQTHNQ